VAVDRRNLERKPRNSFYYYAKIGNNNHWTNKKNTKMPDILKSLKKN
jgi:beta-glucosidase/6-phospho-beta-glucosidase/beta-galactosidase